MATFQSSDDPLEPIRGVEAFVTDGASSEASQSAQLLAMTAYASGQDGATDIQDDADELGVPQLSPRPDLLELYAEPGRLDDITGLEIRHYGESPADLWDGINRDRSVTTLLALLNTLQTSDSDLVAVSAAASVQNLVRGASESAVYRGLNSSDELARGVAEAAFGSARPPGTNPTSSARGTKEQTLSTTINGTWGLVDDDGWYQPGSGLHGLLRDRLSENLYSESDYYGWSGEYSDPARWVAAQDLLIWREARSEPEAIDTVYAHSHGGTVALNAAALGQRIRFLVLLHAPAVPRSAEEWATIRGNVRRVVAMRTRLDLVVLADRFKSNSRQKFDAAQLPHTPVVRHWREREAWFSHSFYVNRANWDRLNLVNIVERESSYAAPWPG
ncbi:MAG TPA: alpha/beta hydrolase [Microbacterium sp.]|uniref:alpha/beta hydrolase n=1 Tax=Microbacterium sp. TaxID=51671 RepID=UPI002B893EC6|nr:alpha/beta hydrolase [Microbacterium sp.]HWI31524.1 alpha/beta hydrolase [Microbacterium sp.]